jgi:hypothetical protein
VVVAAGVMLVEPVNAVEVKAPGVMERLVAPVADQLSMVLEPELMLPGFALNEVILGAETCCTGMVCEAPEPQAARRAEARTARRVKISARCEDGFGESICDSFSLLRTTSL